MEPYILIEGNPIDGYSYYGPYPNAQVAVLAGNSFYADDWWVAPLNVTN